MKKKLISIIIPYCRKKKFFQQTINSIKKQTYRNYELIIVYDDTKKLELDFVKRTIKNIEKKKIIVNRMNQGAGKARNKGIKHSRGEYICFCDADDLWFPKKIEKQLNFMKKNKLSFSHTSYDIIDRWGKKISSFDINSKITYEDLLKSCDIGLSTVMCTKKILQKNKFINTRTKEDYFLWLSIIKKIKVIHGLPLKLTSWRKLDNSLSSPILRRIIDAYLMYSLHNKNNFIKNVFYTFRLSIYALIKKVKIYN
tara:strand:- start:319 stop:1080 length:762 start_codon:yes stop_codon:yes gene_type:complete